MSDYIRFKKTIIDSTNRKVEDKLIKLMFKNWICDNPDNKKGWKTIGVSNHWHAKLKAIMDGLGIDEVIPSSGGFRKATDVKFSKNNLHLFATEQNAIARSIDFKQR